MIKEFRIDLGDSTILIPKGTPTTPLFLPPPLPDPPSLPLPDVPFTLPLHLPLRP
jgi:hypothetical protein